MKLCMNGLLLDFAPFSYFIFPVYCKCSCILMQSGIYSETTAIYPTPVSQKFDMVIDLQKMHTISVSLIYIYIYIYKGKPNGSISAVPLANSK